MHSFVRNGLILSACAGLVSCDAAPADPQPVETCATPLTLRVGEMREFSGASLSCLVVAGADIASEYLFTAANATPQQDDLREYLIRATLTPRSASADRSAAIVVDNDATDALRESDERGLEFGAELEGEVRRAEKQLLGNRSLSSLAAESRRPVAIGSIAPVPGDSLSFRVGNAARTDMCANFSNVRAVVKALGTRVTIVQDVAAPAGGFSDADYRDLASEFDAVTFPTVSDWFGTPSDINGDGRITVLVTPEINRLTPTGSLGYAGGFFFMHDLLPREVLSQNYRCEASNAQEILYLLAPDPGGQVNGNRFSVETARESARGTMAHEVQHMINQGIRQTRGVNALEVFWLNEGLSHFAEEVVGRAARGYGDNQRLDWSRIFTDLDDFDSYFRQNLLRLRFWMERPDLASPISSRAATELAPRGASWALVRYAVDQFGGANPRAFTRALIAGPQVDVPNLSARAGVPFDKLLPGFLIASYGEATSGTLAAAFRFSSWNMRDVMGSLNGGTYPLRLQTFPAEGITRSLSGSGNYFLVSREKNAAPATFSMLATDGGPVTFTGARVYLTRMR